MLKPVAILQNEQGALMIIVSVVILALLTLISIAASRTARTELRISANDYAHQRCFYNAEGGAIEAITRLEEGPNPLLVKPTWMSSADEDIDDQSVFSYWEAAPKEKGAIPRSSVLDPQNTAYLVVHHGVAPGSSLDMSRPARHTFSIYSRCKNKGPVILKIGYAKIY